MFRNSKYAGACAVASVSVLVLAGCASGAGPETNADGSTIVDFWHASSGAAGQTLQALVDEFNAAHKGQIEVVASYQGSYEDEISKFISSVQTHDLPVLLQASDVQTAFLRDSQLVTPASEFAKSGDYDFSQLVPPAANYYTMDGTVWSMPALVSQPEIYVNNDLLEQAGVDPTSLDTTTKLLDAAQAVHDSTGKFGLTFHQSGWYMEEFTAMLGKQWCTPENGTGTDQVSTFSLSDPDVTAFWSRMSQLYGADVIQNPGTDGAAATGAFLSGQAAIQLNSSGNYGNVIDGDPAFNWSIVPLPRDTEDAGAVPGGNSLWVINDNHSQAQQQAAWEFMKFIGSDEVQQRIFKETGYLPTTKTAARELDGLTPQQQVMIDQLLNTPVNTVTAGCHTGALNAARTDYQAAMSTIANAADAPAALAKAQQAADKTIKQYVERLP